DLLGRYADEAVVLERALAIKPDDLDTKVARAFVELAWKADSRPLHQLIDSIRVTEPSAMPSLADAWLTCALAERDATAATAALSTAGENPLSDDVVRVSRPFMEGVTSRTTNDQDRARAAFIAARVGHDKLV